MYIDLDDEWLNAHISSAHRHTKQTSSSMRTVKNDSCACFEKMFKLDNGVSRKLVSRNLGPIFAKINILKCV